MSTTGSLSPMDFTGYVSGAIHDLFGTKPSSSSNMGKANVKMRKMQLEAANSLQLANSNRHGHQRQCRICLAEKTRHIAAICTTEPGRHTGMMPTSKLQTVRNKQYRYPEDCQAELGLVSKTVKPVKLFFCLCVWQKNVQLEQLDFPHQPPSNLLRLAQSLSGRNRPNKKRKRCRVSTPLEERNH